MVTRKFLAPIYISCTLDASLMERTLADVITLLIIHCCGEYLPVEIRFLLFDFIILIHVTCIFVILIITII